MDSAINAWRTVVRDGLPKYQPNVTYIGINSAGYAACFTIADEDGSCWAEGAEESICVMSALLWWRVLDRPDVSSSADGSGVPVCPDCGVEMEPGEPFFHFKDCPNGVKTVDGAQP